MALKFFYTVTIRWFYLAGLGTSNHTAYWAFYLTGLGTSYPTAYWAFYLTGLGTSYPTAYWAFYLAGLGTSYPTAYWQFYHKVDSVIESSLGSKMMHLFIRSETFVR